MQEKEEESNFPSRKKWAMPGARYPGTVLAARKGCDSVKTQMRHGQIARPTLREEGCVSKHDNTPSSVSSAHGELSSRQLEIE